MEVTEKCVCVRVRVGGGGGGGGGGEVGQNLKKRGSKYRRFFIELGVSTPLPSM